MHTAFPRKIIQGHQPSKHNGVEGTTHPRLASRLPRQQEFLPSVESLSALAYLEQRKSNFQMYDNLSSMSGLGGHGLTT